jgi:rubredoxin
VSQQEVVQLTPVSLEWWDAAQGAAPPAPSPAAQRAPAPDLSSYLDSTIIAQCPNCGAFRLDFRRARNGWDFRCESCRYIWSWQPGTPWPPVRVAPALRTEQQGTERPRP